MIKVQRTYRKLNGFRNFVVKVLWESVFKLPILQHIPESEENEGNKVVSGFLGVETNGEAFAPAVEAERNGVIIFQ